MTSDNELLCLYVNTADNAALERLIRRHSGMVLSVCRSLLLQKEDAEDAFQAVFILLSTKAPNLLCHNSVGGWLHESATRICLQRRRQIARNREVTMVEEPTNDSEPWQSIAEARNLEALHHEIARLPRKYREVLLLYHFEGKSRAQIANRLDCTTASVKACLARARELLRRRLLHKGITASFVLACAAASARQSYADTGTVFNSLIQSTLEHCQGLQPTVDVGNGPSVVESLLAKETTMAIGTVHTFTSAGISAVVLCVAAVTAIAATPQDQADEVVQVDVSTSNVQQTEAPQVTSSFVVQNDAGEDRIRTPNRNSDEVSVDSIEEEYAFTTDVQHSVVRKQTTGGDGNSPSSLKISPNSGKQLSMQLLKSDGTQITYSTPKLSTKQVPQNTDVKVEYNENDGKTIRTEKRTQSFYVDLPGGTVETPVPDDTVFESVDGSVLTRQTVIQRIGKGELPVIVLGSKEKLSSDWQQLLNSDAVIARNDRLMRASHPFRVSTKSPQYNVDTNESVTESE